MEKPTASDDGAAIPCLLTARCGAQEFQGGPTVRQLLDCGSPLALSHAHATEPKAAEDCLPMRGTQTGRNPRRSALSRPDHLHACCARMTQADYFSAVACCLSQVMSWLFGELKSCE